MYQYAVLIVIFLTAPFSWHSSKTKALWLTILILLDKYKLHDIIKGEMLLGKKNVLFNNFLSAPARFADLCNFYFFSGRDVIREKDLFPADTKFWRTSRGAEKEFSGDQLKLWNPGNGAVLLGVEPEENIQYALPVKYMNYESLQYDKNLKEIQREHRDNNDLSSEEYISGFSAADRLCPVLILGVYLGQERWQPPDGLKDILALSSLPEEIQNGVRDFSSDFRINFLDIHDLTSTDMFRSDLKEVFGFLSRREDKEALEAYIAKHESFRHLRKDTFEVIMAYSGGEDFDVHCEDYKTEEGYDMCLAFQQMRDEGIDIGEKRGRAEGFDCLNQLIQKLN